MYYIKQSKSINQQTKTLDDKPYGNFECKLVISQSYIESFEIKPISFQKDVVELVIKTQLLTAKNPSEWRIKSRTCAEVANLKELHKVISDYLKDQSSSPHELN
jgi:hypothetical protein